MSLVLNRKRDRVDNDVDNEMYDHHRVVKLHIKKSVDTNRKRPHNPSVIDNKAPQEQKRNKMTDNSNDRHEFEYGTMHSTYAYDPIKMVFL